MTLKFFLFTSLLYFSTQLTAADIYVTTSDLKLRKSASSKSNVIEVIKKGTEIQIIDKSDVDWYKANYHEQIGFLSSRYLSFVRSESEIAVISTSKITEPESGSGWGWILLIGAGVSYIIYRKSKKKMANQNQKESKNTSDKKSTLSDKIKISYSEISDDSIIDVTGKSQRLHNGLVKYVKPVPVWKHKYIYSYSELKAATESQKEFYKVFKSAFLSGQYLDLEGNLNYAFILLFDLASNLESSPSETERLLITLGRYYPKTESYAISLIQDRNKEAKVISIQENSFYARNNNNTEYGFEDWRLGSRYKTKLKLKTHEVEILDKLIDTNNKFNSLEHCAIELIKLFLASLSELENELKKRSTSLIEECNTIAEIEISKHYRYRKGSYNYKSAFEVFINNIHQTVFKICENKLRDIYDVGRKTDLNWYIHSAEALAEFRSRIEVHLNPILELKSNEINAPDFQTEISLNEYNKARWKGKLAVIERNFAEAKLSDYIQAIEGLEQANKKNPSIENIFFQSSKFISKHDKLTALKLYIDYLHYDLKSVKFDNKQLTKTIQKSLFENEQQLKQFESIIGEFVKDRNRKKAIEAVSTLYLPKRKKIVLDKTTIKEVNEKHAGTVELLNVYLQDEIEEKAGHETEKAELAGSSEVSINISSSGHEPAVLSNGVGLNSNQIELLEFITKNSYTITALQAESFAKSKGLFRNSLIEGINNTCFDKLDDVLIEEDGDTYTINENYYNKIFLS